MTHQMTIYSFKDVSKGIKRTVTDKSKLIIKERGGDSLMKIRKVQSQLLLEEQQSREQQNESVNIITEAMKP